MSGWIGFLDILLPEYAVNSERLCELYIWNHFSFSDVTVSMSEQALVSNNENDTKNDAIGVGSRL